MPKTKTIAVIGLPLLLTLLSCTPAASSFETLRIPNVAIEDDEAAIIVGWARESRATWKLLDLYVDGHASESWSARDQRPRVIALVPGSHTIRLRFIEQNQLTRDPRATSRYYRPRPVDIRLARGELQLCALYLAGKSRQRPRLVCSHYRGPNLPADEPLPQKVAGSSDAQTPRSTAAAGDSGVEATLLEALVERLEHLERRLDELDATCAPCPPEGARTPSRFAQEFDDERSERRRDDDGAPPFDTSFP